MLHLWLLTGLLACAPDDSPSRSTGGVTSVGGAGGTTTGGTNPGGGTGGTTLGGSGGVLPTGGAATGGIATGGVSVGGASTGGVPSGGMAATGGVAAGPGTGGVMLGGTGGTSGSGGVGATGGTGGAGTTGGSSGSGGTGTGGELVGPGSYALPPPSQCHNQDYIDYQEGCKEGDPASTCGGKCNTINACLESKSEKPYADITFICPRFMLFSAEMKQAAIDDGNSAFNYAIVGHDADRGGIDGSAESTCCQCYQLVYAYPSPNNDRQCLANPDNPNPPVSGLNIPKPLIVQSFNTAATPQTFDVYMAAGGLGANNACAPVAGSVSRSGEYLYTGYSEVGQTSGGGIKPVTHFSECKTQYQWVNTETLGSEACQSRVTQECNKITSDIPGLTEQARDSCMQSNSPDSPYHLNWSVYVAKVECPEHLTEVTGCKLAPQGLPEVKRDVITAAQADADADFFDKSSGGSMYETTTMEDCCRPSCASVDWISKKGLTTDPEYNAFYSCDPSGVPITEDP